MEGHHQSDLVQGVAMSTSAATRFRSIQKKPIVSLSLSFAVNIVPRSCTFQAPEASAAHDPKTMTQRLEFINYAGGADLLLETCGVALTGTGR